MLIWKLVCMLHHTLFLSLRFPEAFWCALKTALGNSWKSFVFKQLSVARNKASMLAWGAFNVFRIKAKPQNVLHSCFIYNPYFHTILSLSKQEFSQPTLADRLQLSEFLTAFFKYVCASGYLLMVTRCTHMLQLSFVQPKQLAWNWCFFFRNQTCLQCSHQHVSIYAFRLLPK